MTVLPIMLALTGATVTCPTTLDTTTPRTVLEHAQITACSSVTEQFETARLTLMAAENVPDEVLYGTLPMHAGFGVLRAGRMPLTIEWTNARGLRQRGVLWFRVNGLVNTWVFSADLSAGTVIEPRHVVRASVDAAAENLVKAQLPQAPQGQAVARGVRKGSVVRIDWLRPPALVRRRQPVKVHLRRDGLDVQARGMALTTGWTLNDEVQIEIGAAPVMAKVSGKDEVYVEM